MLAGFVDPSIESAESFRVLLDAMARPGRLYSLPDCQAPEPIAGPLARAILTLVDDTTPIYVDPAWDSDELRQWVAFHTAAPVVEAAHATFAIGTLAGMGDLTRFPKGDDRYPDRGCTLLLQHPGLEAAGAQLSGPGIEDTHHLNIPAHPQWEEARGPYPQGLDVFWFDQTQVAGWPRSTQVVF